MLITNRICSRTRRENVIRGWRIVKWPTIEQRYLEKNRMTRPIAIPITRLGTKNGNSDALISNKMIVTWKLYIVNELSFFFLYIHFIFEFKFELKFLCIVYFERCRSKE